MEKRRRRLARRLTFQGAPEDTALIEVLSRLPIPGAQRLIHESVQHVFKILGAHGFGSCVRFERIRLNLLGTNRFRDRMA